jgi:hypothetical protein
MFAGQSKIFLGDLDAMSGEAGFGERADDLADAAADIENFRAGRLESCGSD